MLDDFGFVLKNLYFGSVIGDLRKMGGLNGENRSR